MAKRSHSRLLVVAASFIIGLSSSFSYVTFHAPGGLPEAWDWETSLFYSYGVSNLIAVIMVPICQNKIGLTIPMLGILMLAANSIGYVLFALAFAGNAPSWRLAMLGRAINGLGGEGTVIFGQAVVWEMAGGGLHETLAMGIFFMVVSGFGSGCSFTVFTSLHDNYGKHVALLSLVVWCAASWALLAAHYYFVKPLLPPEATASTILPSVVVMETAASPLLAVEPATADRRVVPDKGGKTASACKSNAQLILLAVFELIPIGAFQYVAVNFWPKYLVNSHGVDELIASSLGGLIYLLVTVFAPVWGLLLDMVPSRRQRSSQTAAMSMGCAVALAGVVYLNSSIGTEAICCVLIGIGLSPLESISAVLVNHYAEEGGYGSTSAYAFTVSLPVSVGILVAPVFTSSDESLILSSEGAMLVGLLVSGCLYVSDRVLSPDAGKPAAKSRQSRSTSVTYVL